MAFRPFEFFRKRQKVFLAIMAIAAMFLFVVGDALMGIRSGSGGILGRLTGLFGTPRDRVAVVGGDNINFQRLRELAAQREGAWQLVQAVRGAQQEAILRNDANFTDVDFRLRESQNAEDRKRFADRLRALQISKPEVWRKLEQTTSCMANDAVAGFDAFTSQMALFEYLQRHGRIPKPPLNAESLVEFIWWKNKADELGIVFSNDVVKKNLLQVAGYKEKPNSKEPSDELLVKADELPSILRKAKLRGDLDTLLTWLGDEMRVMVAKGAMLGQPRRNGFGTGPLSTQATPLDLWNAYVDVRTQLEVGILPIKVNQPAFMGQVPDPSQEQVKEFYTKYKSQLPDPARDTPGFTIPKLYKVEFVYADLRPTADAGKYYHEWARAIQTLDPVAFFGEVVEFYRNNKATRYRIVDPFVISVAGTKPEDATYYRSPLISSTGPWLSPTAAEQQNAAQYVLGVSGVLAAAPAVSLGFEPSLSPTGKIIPREQEQATELAALVGDASATAGLGLGVGGLLTYPPRLGYVEKYQPLDKEFGGIVDELTEARAHKLLEQDLAQLKKDLTTYGEIYRKEYAKWRARPGFRSDSSVKFTPPPHTYKKDGMDVSEPMETFVQRFAQARGLKYEGMKDLRSRADLFKEKETTPLGSLLKPLFFQVAFRTGANFEMEVAEQLTPVGPLYQAKRIPEEQQMPMMRIKPREYVLHWKQQEVDARTPPLEECQTQVVEAWKVQEARALADKAANELAQKAHRDGPDGYRLLLDSKEGEYAEKTLARFESSALGVGVLNYQRAAIPTIEHPPDSFMDDVLKTLQEPGQTMVVANKPKSIYYVLFLRERKQPRASDPLAVYQFDQQVILPNQQRQMQVDRMPISEWVLREQTERYQRDWEKYFKDATRYNQELAEQFKPGDRDRQ
jgi:hypothetical protein